jgi:hypothetical protein
LPDEFVRPVSAGFQTRPLVCGCLINIPKLGRTILPPENGFQKANILINGIKQRRGCSCYLKQAATGGWRLPEDAIHYLKN